ncbi:hypothetical protein CCR84_09105 [Rhodocyclus purpureus]|nr:hypothetical protein [Rhodocyclus purpureus]
MRGRSLCASINQREVGTLQVVGGIWSFRYTGAWLYSPQGFVLSPPLPLAAAASPACPDSCRATACY